MEATSFRFTEKCTKKLNTQEKMLNITNLKENLNPCCVNKKRAARITLPEIWMFSVKVGENRTIFYGIAADTSRYGFLFPQVSCSKHPEHFFESKPK